MKKLIVTSFILAIASGSFAQGFYLRLGLGYAFPEAAQTIDGTATPYNGTTTNPATGGSSYPMTNSIKSASFTAGVQGAIGLGYMFTENVGVQLDAGLGIATKKYTYDDQNVDLGGSIGDLSYIQQAKSPFIVTPSLVVQTGGDPWNIYARLGLALPLSTTITEDQVATFSPGTVNYQVQDISVQIKNSFSLGFAAAAGVQYQLNDRLSIFGELSLLSMSVFIKQSTVTGINVIAGGVSTPYPPSSVSPTVINYSKKATIDSSGSEAPAYSQPFSNLGVNVGISLKLGKTHPRHSKHSDDDLIDDSKPFKRH